MSVRNFSIEVFCQNLFLPKKLHVGVRACCNIVIPHFRLVNAVEAFAENIPVPENETVIFKEKNLAVGVAVVEDKKVVQNGYFIKGNVDASETSLEMNDGTGSRDSKQVANIFLPGPLFTKAKNQAGGNASATRVTTFLYDNEKLFISEETSGTNAKKKLNSRILAVSIKGIKLENLTDDQRIKSEFKALNKTGSNTVRCVYWEETTRGLYLDSSYKSLHYRSLG